DGISLAQTAEGGLGEISAALQRVRELAVQSANATNTSVDRDALNKEVSQILSEIDRVATQTQFNGKNLLDGTLGNQAFQVGAFAGQTINVGLSTGMRTNQIGQIAQGTGTAAVSATATTGGTTKINGTVVTDSVAGSANGQAADSAYAKAEAINSSGIEGVRAEAVTGTRKSNVASKGVDFSAAAETYTLKINSVTILSLTAADATATDLTQQELVDQVNLYTSQTGVTAAVNGTDINLTASDGRNIDLTGTAYTGAGAAAFNVADVTRGSVKLTSADSITIADTGNTLGFGATATVTKDTTTIDSIDVLSVANSNNTIDRVDAAIAAVNSFRAELGAIQNRFESATSQLNAQAENLTAARSRIRDADFAAETADLTRNQILQQAGLAMVSQANSLPQQVLGLLQ
ncbi:MAG: flagellin, partial [Gammaproteobacteria bacterium]|nr:flagellin [Gammaproteobacteria bacterium]